MNVVVVCLFVVVVAECCLLLLLLLLLLKDKPTLDVSGTLVVRVALVSHLSAFLGFTELFVGLSNKGLPPAS